jgi:hypothetical protein
MLQFGTPRLGSAALAFFLMTGLNACAMATPGESGGTDDPLPDDAIAVGPDLYMRPMGVDDGGCPVFQPWSPTLMVVQALHWRTADGAFTLDRGTADCPASQGNGAAGQNDNR